MAKQREKITKKKKRYDREPSEWEKGWADLREEYSIKALIPAVIVLFFCMSILSGLFIQNFQIAIRLRKSIAIAEIPLSGLTNIFGLLFTVGLTLGVIQFVFWIKRRHRKEYHTDRERNYDISDKHAYGDADFQDENEINRCFYRTDDPMKIVHNRDILGRGIEDGMIYSLRDDLVSMNEHMAVVGSSGSGKSAFLVKNKIYQGILRGDSMVVTDSKGDLYTDLARLAHDYGYVVKVLNLKSGQLMNSDGCDFLKNLGDDDVKAGVMAETIIKNTEGDERLDYWAKNEMNLVKALMLYISTDNIMTKMNKNNLAEIYNIVATKSLEELHQIFGIMDPDHPAKQAFNLFAEADPKIQGQIVNGLGIRLQILSNKWAKKVVSSDEIDLTLPMKKKCIYFVVISDTETTYKFIATLFFAELFIELCDFYDKVSQKCRTKNLENPCLPVNFILDEFANTGAIPEFNVKISTVRSRRINITMIIQDIGQLIDMYGDNLAYTILNNMSLKMLLKTTDYNTAKYFSDIMGIQTVRIENRRYDQKATEIIHAHDVYTVTEGMGKRQLMNPDELINSMDNDHLILCVSGFHPVKLKKFIFVEHPLTKQCRFTDPGLHTPKWRKEIDKERAERGLPPIWVPQDVDIDLTGETKEKVKRPSKRENKQSSDKTGKNTGKTTPANARKASAKQDNNSRTIKKDPATANTVRKKEVKPVTKTTGNKKSAERRPASQQKQPPVETETVAKSTPKKVEYDFDEMFPDES